ncbi:BnaC02g16890D [Brassica napus]|uniref:BnaC02g16890D protein n=1 Tax=Brassica napus TaxID=3708 RepID=A0A078IL12_BRANA|nr:BnaC02g16890D [Brassica napus]
MSVCLMSREYSICCKNDSSSRCNILHPPHKKRQLWKGTARWSI